MAAKLTTANDVKSSDTFIGLRASSFGFIVGEKYKKQPNRLRSSDAYRPGAYRSRDHAAIGGGWSSRDDDGDGQCIRTGRRRAGERLDS